MKRKIDTDKMSIYEIDDLAAELQEIANARHLRECAVVLSKEIDDQTPPASRASDIGVTLRDDLRHLADAAVAVIAMTMVAMIAIAFFYGLFWYLTAN